MHKRIVDPEKYGMVTCPLCGSRGYVLNPERQCCPKCGGFGFVKKRTEEETNRLSPSGSHD